MKSIFITWLFCTNVSLLEQADFPRTVFFSLFVTRQTTWLMHIKWKIIMSIVNKVSSRLQINCWMLNGLVKTINQELGQVVWKPFKSNPGFKVKNAFPAYILCSLRLFKPKQKEKQYKLTNLLKSYKTKIIRNLTNPGLDFQIRHWTTLPWA